MSLGWIIFYAWACDCANMNYRGVDPIKAANIAVSEGIIF